MGICHLAPNVLASIVLNMQFGTDLVNVFFHLCLLYLLLHSLSRAVVSRQQWALMGSEEPLTAVFPVEVQGALAQPDV